VLKQLGKTVRGDMKHWTEEWPLGMQNAGKCGGNQEEVRVLMFRKPRRGALKETRERTAMQPESTP